MLATFPIHVGLRRDTDEQAEIGSYREWDKVVQGRTYREDHGEARGPGVILISGHSVKLRMRLSR